MPRLARSSVACGVERSMVALIAALGVAAAPIASHATPFVIGLGWLRGGLNSQGVGLSGDGSVAVGVSESSPSPQQAFRWTQVNGMQGLGDLTGGAFWSEAVDASSDGSVIVGDGTGSTAVEAFRWTEAGGLVGLGGLTANGYVFSFALGVSGDGSVVVGGSFSGSTTEAFRWTQAGGMAGLGTLAGGWSTARDVSLDGTIVVGDSGVLSNMQAFRWTQAEGMVGLGYLPGGTAVSVAQAISDDGSTIVGYGSSTSGTEAFRWTQADGMVGLGSLSASGSLAYDVSADGSIVVGLSGGDAFVWDAVHGMRSLEQVLTVSGVDLDGWELHSALAVSADGRTIVGSGIHFGPTGGNPQAFIAFIPEPATCLLLAFGVGMLAVQRRRAPRG